MPHGLNPRPPACQGNPVQLSVIPTGAERREAACLDDTRLAELVALAKRIERHFGSHQDIEWSIERGTGALYALQARPVTAERDAPAVSGSAISLVMDAFGAGDRR